MDAGQEDPTSFDQYVKEKIKKGTDHLENPFDVLMVTKNDQYTLQK